MRLFGPALLLVFVAACSQDQGTRCNPLQYSDNGSQGDCANGLACVYPTAANCGVAYCCAVDSKGNIIDKNPNCQPDPSLAAVCMLVDLSIAPGDGGAKD